MQGSLLWMYPTLALSVILEPNLANGKYSAACVRPLSPNIYVEKGDKIHLLVNEAHGTQRVTLFLLANPQKNISGRTVGFQYELLSKRKTGLGLQNCHSGKVSDINKLKISTYSCGHTEQWGLLPTALCIFVHKIIFVSGMCVYIMENVIFLKTFRSLYLPTFSPGRLLELLQCRVKKGPVVFLFTDSKHFGKAWLGCALRFKDFLHIYKKAKLQKYNPCEFQAD
uniref:Meteorin-like protein n=1 Tax=Xenopus tropicalis TaxID=8364 RepID=A0A803K9I5_XENTR